MQMVVSAQTHELQKAAGKGARDELVWSKQFSVRLRREKTKALMICGISRI
jgi:hypothetical protein